MFSIIVPIYNVEKYLDKCIESVINQNYEDYEIILIDDCSTDNSFQIALKYANKKKMKLIKKEKNSGLSDTRNLGIKKATGEYIIFLDSDDYIENESLKKIENIIKENGFPDIAYFGYYEEYEANDEQKKKYGYKMPPNELYSSYQFMIGELGKRNLYAAVCFGIYRRELLISNDLFFYSGLLHEDELWTPEVILSSKSIYLSDYIFYHYLRHNSSITKQQNRIKNGMDIMRICIELKKKVENVSEVKLRRYLNNHIAMLYMKGISDSELYKSEYKKNIKRVFPLQNAFFIPDILKALIFAIDINLYNFLNKKYIDIKKRR